MSLFNFDHDLAIVALYNTLIVIVCLAAACFLIYIGRTVAGGCCISLPLFICMNYHVSRKS